MLAQFMRPDSVRKAFRDPITWAALIIDMIPFYAVLMFGWGATPLVFLYWLENLVIGVVTIARMVTTGVGKGAAGIAGIAFMVPFFIVHYGMFCFGHGIGLVMLNSDAFSGNSPSPIDQSYPEIIQYAQGTGAGMATFITIIFAFNMFLFAWDFIGKRQFLEADLAQEMFAPYGRIIALHIALFAGMFALISFGEPMIGVLALVGLRALAGVFMSVARRNRLDQKVDGAS